MKIAIDVTPIKKKEILGHRVRGTGVYIEGLINALHKYFPQHQYMQFIIGETLPKDIDVIHHPYFEPFFLTLPLVKNVRTIVTVHDLTPIVFPNKFPRGIKGEVKWQIQKRLLRKTDAIITDSLSSQRDIIKYVNYPQKKTHVVYLSADESFRIIKERNILDSIQKKYLLPNKFVLYVGDVTWNKNLPNLLRGIRKAKIPLVMVGKALTQEPFDQKNPWNQDLLRVKKLIEEFPNVTLLGFIPTDDLVVIYNLAEVFVMPSLYEGFGLPILEAMQCGCPVVTANNSSISEITNDAAYYVDPYTIESIAEGIEKVFKDGKLKKDLSEKGIKQAHKFSWEKTVNETINVYKSVVMGNGY